MTEQTTSHPRMDRDITVEPVEGKSTAFGACPGSKAILALLYLYARPDEATGALEEVARRQRGRSMTRDLPGSDPCLRLLGANTGPTAILSRFSGLLIDPALAHGTGLVQALALGPESGWSIWQD